MKNKVWGINVIGSQGVNVDDDFIIGSSNDGDKVVVKVGIAEVSEDKFKELEEGELGTKVIANPEGIADDTLNKIQIGEMIYDIEGGGSSGGEGFLTAANEEEAAALCKEENLGKYVKYVGNPISVAKTQSDPESYKVDFNSNTFLTKIENAEVNYNIVYDGIKWKHGTNEVNLSEYGVSLYNGTPITPPSIGSAINLYFNTDVYPTKAQLDEIAAKGNILTGVVTGYYNIPVILHVGTFEEEFYGLLATISEEGYDQTMPVYCSSLEDPEVFEWEQDVVEEVSMIFSASYGTQLSAVNAEAYALCSDFMSCYSFPHSPYIPESELPKAIGDMIAVQNKHVAHEWAQVGVENKYTGETLLYYKNIPGIAEILKNSITYQQYSWSQGRSVAPLYKYIVEGYDSEIYYAFYFDDSDEEDRRIQFCYFKGDDYSTAGSIYIDDMSENYISIGSAFSTNRSFAKVTVTEVYLEQIAVLKQFFSFSKAFGDEVLNNASCKINFVNRFNAAVDGGIFYEAVKNYNENEIQFRYDGTHWISSLNIVNSNPIVESDIGTELEHIYFNIYGIPTVVEDKIARFGMGEASYESTSFQFDEWVEGVYLLPNEAREFAALWSSESYEGTFYGMISLKWAKGFDYSLFDNDGKLLNNAAICSYLTDDGGIIINSIDNQEALNKLCAKSPFTCEHNTAAEMLSKYGITITGEPQVGSIINLICRPSAYEQYRLYTVKRVSNNDNSFGYELLETYTVYSDIDVLDEKINTKQDKLTAGRGINIATGMISDSILSVDSTNALYFNRALDFNGIKAMFANISTSSYESILMSWVETTNPNNCCDFILTHWGGDSMYRLYCEYSGGSTKNIFTVYNGSNCSWGSAVANNGLFTFVPNSSANNLYTFTGSALPNTQIGDWDGKLVSITPNFTQQTCISLAYANTVTTNTVRANSVAANSVAANSITANSAIALAGTAIGYWGEAVKCSEYNQYNASSITQETLKFVKLTQTQYNNLGTKDSHTLYIIV